MRDNHPGEVQDYTDAFLTMSAAILFMTFWIIAALAGYLWVAIMATACDRAIRWIGRART